jgi:Bacterial mobilisation protein (MobC)
MSATHILKARVPEHLKQRVHALAECELITEAIWLRRLISAAVKDVASAARGEGAAASNPYIPSLLTSEARQPGTRVCIRLRKDDLQLLRERAQSRGLASATYVSVLVRVHLRQLAPLPQDELRALKRTVAELSLVGRNLNQIARAANQGQAVAVSQKDLKSVLQSCDGLRRHVSDLIRTNVLSWEVGAAQAQD